MMNNTLIQCLTNHTLIHGYIQTSYAVNDIVIKNMIFSQYIQSPFKLANSLCNPAVAQIISLLLKPSNPNPVDSTPASSDR